MRSFLRSTGPMILGLVVLIGLLMYPAFGGSKDKPASWTGTVTDSMCGANHPAGMSPADCTRACVQKGGSFALLVGDKVYTLKGGDAATLDKLAGEKATVSGALDGTTIAVSSIEAAK